MNGLIERQLEYYCIRRPEHERDVKAVKPEEMYGGFVTAMRQCGRAWIEAYTRADSTNRQLMGACYDEANKLFFYAMNRVERSLGEIGICLMLMGFSADGIAEAMNWGGYAEYEQHVRW